MPQLTLQDGAGEDSDQYISDLQSLVAIPNLELLRINNWPTMPENSFVEGSDGENDDLHITLNRTRYMQAFVDFMTAELSKTFEAAGLCNGSQVVSYSSVDSNQASDSITSVQLPIVSFTPGKQIDAFGNARVVATRLTTIDAKYLLEKTSLFDWNQNDI